MFSSVILCRSVIDTALDDKLSQRFMDKHGDYGKGNTLENRITALERSGLVPPETTKILTNIRLRGNKCVHGELDAVNDIKGTISDTCKALIVICEVDL